MIAGGGFMKKNQSESAFPRSEELFQELFYRANDAIYLHEITETGLPGRFIEVNRAACERLGYTREELLAMTPMEIDDPALRGNIPEIIRSAEAQGRITFEMVHVGKNGRRLPVEISTHLFMLAGRRVALSIARDIAVRKEMEGQLRENGKELQGLFDAITDSAFLMDASGIVLALNETAARRLGRSIDEIRGHGVFDLLPPDVAERRKAHFDEVVLTGRSVRFEDERQGLWLDNHIYPITDRDGKTANDAIISTDGKGKITFWNRMAEEIFGYPSADAVGQPITIIIPERFHEKHRPPISRPSPKGSRRRSSGRSCASCGAT